MAQPQVLEIPLQANHQQLQVVLAGVIYTLVVRWNQPSQCWIMSVFDNSSNPILQGIPLVTGLDLLGQFEYLALGAAGQFIVQTDHDTFNVPTFTNLGITGHLYFLPG